jgi:hypothetical protein
MEAPFPDRYNVLSKLILLRNLILMVTIIIGIGCDRRKDYHVDPVPVFSKVVKIDSAYTRVSVISTGDSDSLFCGKKGIFDSYSIMKFDSIPEGFDSLFIKFRSDSTSVVLSLYELKMEWSEDSTYLWDDIGSLIDTLTPIQVSAVDSTDPIIFIGDSSSLDYSIIDAINSFGLAVHSDSFYSFNAGETRLKVESEDTLLDSIFGCVEDAYLVKNPFQDTIFTDSLLVGRGLSISTYIFIPRDSLPSDFNSIAKAEMLFDITDSIPFSVRAIYSSPTLFLYRNSSMLSDSLKFDLTTVFRNISDDSIFLQIRAAQVTEGIDIERLSDGEIKFIWVEFPR